MHDLQTASCSAIFRLFSPNSVPVSTREPLVAFFWAVLGLGNTTGLNLS
jgi:CBS-domain-containing membrane protein